MKFFEVTFIIQFHIYDVRKAHIYTSNEEDGIIMSVLHIHIIDEHCVDNPVGPGTSPRNMLTQESNLHIII